MRSFNGLLAGFVATGMVVGCMVNAASGMMNEPAGVHTGKAPALAELASMAMSDDPAVAMEAIGALRAAGPDGLTAFLASHPDLANDAVLRRVSDAPDQQRFRVAVDAIARQRDAAFSGLYWYTDLEAAKQAAQLTDKPILSLRLLGDLDADLSCANSRYFRTLLYPDPAVSQELRDGYVLHWESVRSVPVITIDLGNGHRIERTITGNSLHYILSPQGDVLDVLPGLFSPGAFVTLLKEGRALGNAVATAPESPLGELVRRERLQQPNAVEAGRRAVGKMIAEGPLLNQVASRDSLRAERELVLRAIAPLVETEPVAISEPSINLMWQKRFGRQYDPLSVQQHRTMASVVSAFGRAVAEDTILNRDALRPEALRWLADGTMDRQDLARLTERIYADLFLTPLDDPWMGLASDEAYSGLESEGLRRQ